MKKDLTNSNLDRQNILNNDYAISEIEKATNIKGIPFNGSIVVLKEQVASFFNVTERTIENYIDKYNDELTVNGYVVLKGKSLKDFKNSLLENNVTEIDFGNISRAPQLGIFDFRAFLNIAMLLTESESAKLLRQTILDIVIDVVNSKAGGQTKYINQRESTFLTTYFDSENYRKDFTNALKDYVDMGSFKYPNYTNKIYVAIFKENANEYKKILKLESKDNLRRTLYTEVLDLVSSFELGFAEELKDKYNELGRKLTNWETDILFDKFSKKTHWIPLIKKARSKMASRDLTFRDAYHDKLEEYISPINKADFEKFIGNESKSLEEQIKDSKDVLIRMKDK